MTFSIVVVVSRGIEDEDRWAVFKECFTNLISQNYPVEEFEIVVVNSGSGFTDPELNLLKTLSQSKSIKFSYCDSAKDNVGPAKARNIGIKLVSDGKTKIKSDVIAFTDDDVMVPLNWLRDLSKTLGEYPVAAGVGGMYNPSESDCRSNLFAFYDRYIYKKYFNGRSGDTFYISSKRDEHPVFTGNIAYKRPVLEEIGGFDESFEPFIYGEDGDLKERILDKGYFLVYVPSRATHLSKYNLHRFIRQQESRGAGILKFRQKHNLDQQGRAGILLRLLATPAGVFYYLAKYRDAKIALLETAAYFFRQVGKLKYYDRVINCHSGQRAGIQEPGSQVKSFDTELRTVEVPGMTEIINSIDKIKILFADHTPLVGGAQLALLRHLKYLNKNIFTPVVVVSKQCLDFNHKLGEISGLSRYFINFPRLKTFNPFAIFSYKLACLRLYLIALKESPDVLVANTERAFYVCLPAALFCRKKLVLIIRDFEYSRKLLSLTSFKVSCYICVSKKIQDFYGLPKEKSTVLYVGSDIEKELSRVKAEDVIKKKQELGVAENGLVIGFVGRLLEWKGPFVLLKAFAQILKSHQNLNLVFVGDGPGRQNLGELSRTLGIEKRVYFAGFTQNVAGWYRTFDIFVHASIGDEPFATTVVEAAFAKLPIVATGTGGTGEFIEDRINGLLVKPEKESVILALRTLIEDEGLRTRLGKAAYEKAGSGFAEEKVTKAFEQVYKKI